MHCYSRNVLPTIIAKYLVGFLWVLSNHIIVCLLWRKFEVFRCNAYIFPGEYAEEPTYLNISYCYQQHWQIQICNSKVPATRRILIKYENKWFATIDAVHDLYDLHNFNHKIVTITAKPETTSVFSIEQLITHWTNSHNTGIIRTTAVVTQENASAFSKHSFSAVRRHCCKHVTTSRAATALSRESLFVRVAIKSLLGVFCCWDVDCVRGLHSEIITDLTWPWPCEPQACLTHIEHGTRSPTCVTFFFWNCQSRLRHSDRRRLREI